MKSFPPFKDKQAYTIITGSYYMIKNGIKNRLQEKYNTVSTTVVRNLESTIIILMKNRKNEQKPLYNEENGLY